MFSFQSGHTPFLLVQKLFPFCMLGECSTLSLYPGLCSGHLLNEALTHLKYHHLLCALLFLSFHPALVLIISLPGFTLLKASSGHSSHE